MTKTQKLMFSIAALTLGLLILGTREPYAQPVTDYQVCAYYGENARQIVQLRNDGTPISDVMRAIGHMHPAVREALQSIAVIVYGTKRLDAVDFGGLVEARCLNALAGEA